MSRKTQQIVLLLVGLLLAGYLFIKGQNRSKDASNTTQLEVRGSDTASTDSSGMKLIDAELMKIGFAPNTDATEALSKATQTGDSYLFALAIAKRALQKNDFTQLYKTAIEVDSFSVVLENDPRSVNLAKLPETLLRQALTIHPDDINALNTLALIKIYRQDQIMEGVQTLLKVVRLDSNNEDAIYQLGLLAVKSGQTDKAIERFRKLISLQPLKKEYHQQLALLYGQKGDTKNAEKHAVLAR